MIGTIVRKIFQLLLETFLSIVYIALCVVVSIKIASGADELLIIGAILFAVSAVLEIVLGIFDIKILISVCVDVDLMLEDVQNGKDKG